MPISVSRLAYESLNYLKSVSPYDSGNLRENIKALRISNNEYQITIGGAVAPYAVYTNEKWVSPRWHGKKNPNEKWIDMAVQNIVEMISSAVGGEVSYNSEEEQARWDNKNYWDSEEGKRKLREYRMI